MLGATSATREAAAARLLVELTLDVSYDLELFDDDGDDDPDVDESYSASVRFRQFAADGVLLDAGADAVDGEETSFDAAEEALDLVVLRYLRPYRL